MSVSARASDVVLAGRSAVVTGASKGIGFAIAAALTSAGVRTWMLARDSVRLAESALALGENAYALQCDVSDAHAVARVAASITETLGDVPDLLVNNAGTFPLFAIEDDVQDLFSETLQVNVTAPYLFAHAFVGGMRKRGSGHVVTIGSVADRHIFAGNAAYAASKHAQRAFHEVLRMEMQGSGVRATLVSPAPVDTEIWDPIDPDNREGFPPRSRMLRPADVADAVMYAVTRPGHVNVDEIRVSYA